MWDQETCECFESDTICSCTKQGQEYQEYKDQEVKILNAEV
jgi:hypothetical protein